MKAKIYDFWFLKYKAVGHCDNLAALLAYTIEWKSEFYAEHKPEALPAFLREQTQNMEGSQARITSFKQWRKEKKDRKQ